MDRHAATRPPRGGLADINEAPHYFRAVNDYAHPGQPDAECFVWPASQTALAWEREQWAILVELNTRYEAGAGVLTRCADRYD
jgi:hypothetical protein